MRFTRAGCEAQHRADLSGMPAWALASGAGVDPAPLTRWFGSLPALTAYSGDSAPFLGKIHEPYHRPFWLHRCRHRPYETSCHRHYALPRSVSHIDPSLLAGTGTAQSQRADTAPGAGLKRRRARETNARGMALDGLDVWSRRPRRNLRALERGLFSETSRRGWRQHVAGDNSQEAQRCCRSGASLAPLRRMVGQCQAAGRECHRDVKIRRRPQKTLKKQFAPCGTWRHSTKHTTSKGSQTVASHST